MDGTVTCILQSQCYAELYKAEKKMIKLDITGMLFETEAEGGTVQEVTQNAVGNSFAGGTLTKADFDNDGFLEYLEVDFRSGNPTSRQKSKKGSTEGLKQAMNGIYGFSDVPKPDLSNVEVKSPTGIDGVLAWQYYVFKSGNLITSNREIIPAGDQMSLKDGDKIVWRLVTIFGFNQALKEMLQKGQNGSVKYLISMI